MDGSPVFTPLWPGGPVFAPAEHAPVSTDSLLLADFVRPGRARRGLDLGCASGLLSLLLLWRWKNLHMTGLELLPEAAALAEENMARNGLAARSRIQAGDLRAHRSLFAAGSFSLLVCNPPYFPLCRGAAAPDPARALARSEAACRLEDVCDAAAWLLCSGGRLAMVCRSERMAELMSLLRARRLEPKRLRLVSHRAESAPGLMLLEARRDGGLGLTVEPTLVLAEGTAWPGPELRGD